jgi:hypothetical protein
VSGLPGLSPERVAHVTALGHKVIKEVGKSACLRGYGTHDPFWVGHYALGFGDIEEDGTLN